MGFRMCFHHPPKSGKADPMCAAVLRALEDDVYLAAVVGAVFASLAEGQQVAVCRADYRGNSKGVITRANASKFWVKLNHILLIFNMLCDSWLICHEITD
jgi:hypothetical protein